MGKINVFGRSSSKDNLARDGAADAERKTVKMCDGGPEITVSDFRSTSFITSSVGMVLLDVLTLIAREETLGCRERKWSNRGRGISSLIWKDHNLGKVVVFNSVFHRKLVEVASTEQSVSSSRTSDAPNRSGWKGI